MLIMARKCQDFGCLIYLGFHRTYLKFSIFACILNLSLVLPYGIKLWTEWHINYLLQKIFNYPKNTPDKVAEEIEKSFSLFFSDAPSAANHIRIALEELTLLRNFN